VPALVVYEVRRGLLKRANRRLLVQFDRLLRNHAHVHPFDEATAQRAAEEWVTRTRAGKTPGELDLLIAVTGAVLGADVVEGFPEPSGVRLRRWADLTQG
jgi:predicted nucleic acid-binding protein